MPPKVLKETKVTSGHLVSIPALARRQFGIEPGDYLVWEAAGDRLVVRVKKRAGRGFADFEPFDFGKPTDAAQEHDTIS